MTKFKEILQNVNKVLKKIFAVGVIVSLFAGGISLLGYIVALCIGGSAATAICAFIFKQYFPWVIRFTSVIIGVGLVSMYVEKESALTMKTNDTKSEKQEMPSDRQ